MVTALPARLGANPNARGASAGKYTKRLKWTDTTMSEARKAGTATLGGNATEEHTSQLPRKGENKEGKLTIACNELLSRECRFVKCLPKPSFADMVCRVGNMSSVMSATRRHCMLARVSKTKRHVGMLFELKHKKCMVLIAT